MKSIINPINLVILRKACQHFLKSELKDEGDEESNQFSCNGYSILENDRGKWEVYATVQTSGYSYWNPPEFDEVLLATENKFEAAVEQMILIDFKNNLDGFIQSEYECNLHSQEINDENIF